ncbi:MAG: hypothetical protein M2R45_04304 [Verrucomicrobia subdivision 3 bacterium]|nr:hypothetical protein [Limisphaerales bacterium]MCS1411108.1 hypothetical protein [Limisphaerales bacterium]MCS1416789.1 hypothetical protein [Limisphaerales bacterium]MCS1417219.1 hypothetical protein [Limisphaerales bacterium]
MPINLNMEFIKSRLDSMDSTLTDLLLAQQLFQNRTPKKTNR